MIVLQVIAKIKVGFKNEGVIKSKFGCMIYALSCVGLIKRR